MAINRTKALAIAQPKTASRFVLAHFDISNRAEGLHLAVWFNAVNPRMETRPAPTAKDPTATTAVEVEDIVANLGPVEYTGDALDAICADALTRAADFQANKVGAAAALQAGVRDALYSALEASGDIPS